MLLMVIERFEKEAIDEVGARFREKGRMMPADVSYVASWLDPGGTVCYQLMEAPTPESLKPWFAKWDDLMKFEVVPVLSSADFWAQRTKKGAGV